MGGSPRVLALSLANTGALVGKGTGVGGLGMTGGSGSAGLRLIQQLCLRGLLRSLAGIGWVQSCGGIDRFR